MDTVNFDSHGTACAAWYLEAGSEDLARSGGRPCVVMGHGFGATRDSGLLPFAERFAAAGADVLVFDYRGFGTSDGMPRQDVNHREHRQDYHAAVARARSMPGVDPSRIVLWGSSYSGGHVVAVAAQDPRVAAVISQGAAMDGLAALREIARTAGGMDGYRAIIGPTFRNEMCARGILKVALNRPVTFASKLRCPILLIAAEQDNIAPVSSVREVARRAGPLAEFESYPCGHFDIYAGEVFEKSVSAQVDFLHRHLAT